MGGGGGVGGGQGADQLGWREPPASAVIAAFEGWNDAGEAASATITHLGAAGEASAIGEIDPEDYYDFQVTRPVLEVIEGQTRRLAWPTTRLAVAHPANQIGRAHV